MAKAKPIDVQLMRSLLEYAPELGGSCLKWKIDRPGNNGGVRYKAGMMAGCLHHSGYWHLNVNNEHYSAHRIVWAIVYGEDPVVQVDHIAGQEGGNYIENLRLAPRGQTDNNQNARLRKNNTSGYPGVGWKKQNSRWYAGIRVNGRAKHLGYFDTPEEAYAVYLEAKAKLHTFQPVPRETT